jgi:hypothetical protein
MLFVSLAQLFPNVIAGARCQVKMGTPQNGDPRSLFYRENGDPGPHFASILGIPGAQYHGDFGDPLVKMGTTIIDYVCCVFWIQGMDSL